MKHFPLEARRAGVTVTLVSALVISTGGCIRRPRMQTYTSLQPAISEGRRLDLNTATAQDLERLPAIGRVIAERIVEHRSQYGPFRRVEHVMIVRGISERKFRDMEALITVQHTP